MHNIDYYRKNVYGNTLYYIADMDIRQIIQAISGRTTITKQDIHNLELLGFQLTEVIAP
jgi:hypothetical protein